MKKIFIIIMILYSKFLNANIEEKYEDLTKKSTTINLLTTNIQFNQEKLNIHNITYNIELTTNEQINESIKENIDIIIINNSENLNVTEEINIPIIILDNKKKSYCSIYLYENIFCIEKEEFSDNKIIEIIRFISIMKKNYKNMDIDNLTNYLPLSPEETNTIAYEKMHNEKNKIFINNKNNYTDIFGNEKAYSKDLYILGNKNITLNQFENLTILENSVVKFNQSINVNNYLQEGIAISGNENLNVTINAFESFYVLNKKNEAFETLNININNINNVKDKIKLPKRMNILEVSDINTFYGLINYEQITKIRSYPDKTERIQNLVLNKIPNWNLIQNKPDAKKITLPERQYSNDNPQEIPMDIINLVNSSNDCLETILGDVTLTTHRSYPSYYPVKKPQIINNGNTHIISRNSTVREFCNNFVNNNTIRLSYGEYVIEKDLINNGNILLDWNAKLTVKGNLINKGSIISNNHGDYGRNDNERKILVYGDINNSGYIYGVIHALSTSNVNTELKNSATPILILGTNDTYPQLITGEEYLKMENGGNNKYFQDKVYKKQDFIAEPLKNSKNNLNRYVPIKLEDEDKNLPAMEKIQKFINKDETMKLIKTVEDLSKCGDLEIDQPIKINIENLKKQIAVTLFWLTYFELKEVENPLSCATSTFNNIQSLKEQTTATNLSKLIIYKITQDKYINKFLSCRTEYPLSETETLEQEVNCYEFQEKLITDRKSTRLNSSH